MLKFTQSSLVRRWVVGIACVVLLLPLAPPTASAEEISWDVYALPALTTIVLLLCAMAMAEEGETNTGDQAGPPKEQRSVGAKNDKAKGLAEQFATLHTNEAAGPNLKGRVTYPLFEW